MTIKKLFRFFSQREHAEEFIDGRIRIGLMSVYRNIEDARRDESEGEVSFLLDFPAAEYIMDNQTGEYLGERISTTFNKKIVGSLYNPLYLLCTSSVLAKKKKMSEKYGQFMVEIANPSGFLELLKKRWKIKSFSLDGIVELHKVKYNRGGIVTSKDVLGPSSDVAIYSTQKSLRDKEDYEYRFIFFCRNDSNIIPNKLNLFEYLDISIDNNVLNREVYLIE